VTGCDTTRAVTEESYMEFPKAPQPIETEVSFFQCIVRRLNIARLIPVQPPDRHFDMLCS
jgi:hypothetical protein